MADGVGVHVFPTVNVTVKASLNIPSRLSFDLFLYFLRSSCRNTMKVAPLFNKLFTFFLFVSLFFLKILLESR